MYTVEYSIRDMFFDRLAVQQRLDRAELRELSKIGAFIRRRARTRILRRRKRVSAPGEPPSVHSSDSRASLKNILFGYERKTHSVIIGPVRLNGMHHSNGSRISVAQLMEFGGRVQIEQEQLKIKPGGRTRNDGGRDRRFKVKQGEWFRRTGPKVPWKRYRNHTASYAARPYMAPALEAERQAGTIRDMWVGSLERAA